MTENQPKNDPKSAKESIIQEQLEKQLEKNKQAIELLKESIIEKIGRSKGFVIITNDNTSIDSLLDFSLDHEAVASYAQVINKLELENKKIIIDLFYRKGKGNPLNF